jgi:cellulose biosynthesis protein BcsQ
LLDVDGVNATIALIKKLNPGAGYTILPTGFDGRYNEHQTILTLLQDKYPDHIASHVPNRVAMSEAVALGLTVWEHQVKSLQVVRSAYQRLAWRLTESN